MSYVDNNLMPGETVLHRAQVSPIVYSSGFSYLVMAGLLTFYLPVLAFGNPRSIAAYGATALLLLGLVMLLKAYIYCNTTEFVITNMRVIAKSGWISRNLVELRHDKIEGLTMQQTISGRMCNFGTLVLSGTGGDKTYIANIADPSDFCNHAMAAIGQKG